MPLEISEIGIRMRVRDGQSEPGREPSGEDGCGEERQQSDREALVEACVRRVLEILKSGQER